MNKCKGCGLNLQSNDPFILGYTPKSDSDYCERCFKIKNYNYYDEMSSLSNDEIINIINNKKVITFFLCDFLSFNQKVVDLYNSINNEKVFIFTKSDMLPKNLKYQNLVNRLKDKYNINKVILLSIINDEGINELSNIIDNHSSILFAGPSSSGKSSLINDLFNLSLTTSHYQNTTQLVNIINNNDIKIYDVPGFSDDNFNLKYKGVITSKTISLNKDYELLIDDYVIQSDDEVSLTLYLAKELSFQTRKKKDDNNVLLNINDNNDLTIKNGALLYFKNGCNILVNKEDGIDIHPSIVGGK